MLASAVAHCAVLFIVPPFAARNFDTGGSTDGLPHFAVNPVFLRNPDSAGMQNVQAAFDSYLVLRSRRTTASQRAVLDLQRAPAAAQEFRMLVIPPASQLAFLPELARQLEALVRASTLGGHLPPGPPDDHELTAAASSARSGPVRAFRPPAAVPNSPSEVRMIVLPPQNPAFLLGPGLADQVLRLPDTAAALRDRASVPVQASSREFRPPVFDRSTPTVRMVVIPPPAPGFRSDLGKLTLPLPTLNALAAPPPHATAREVDVTVTASRTSAPARFAPPAGRPRSASAPQMMAIPSPSAPATRSEFEGQVSLKAATLPPAPQAGWNSPAQLSESVRKPIREVPTTYSETLPSTGPALPPFASHSWNRLGDPVPGGLAAIFSLPSLTPPAGAPPSGGSIIPAPGRRIEHPPNGRFDIVIVQPSLPDYIPESDTIMRGQPVYTAYLQVGDASEWVLHYSPVDSRTVQSGSVVTLGDPRPVSAPYPKISLVPAALPAAREGFLFVHGMLDKDGTLTDLRILGQDSNQSEPLLSALNEWQFRPAQRGAEATKLEIVFAIPVRRI